jgi:hypothetical protein
LTVVKEYTGVKYKLTDPAVIVASNDPSDIFVNISPYCARYTVPPS